MTLKLAKILPISALLFLASPAAATCTWTSLSDTQGKVVCTATNETAIAGAAGATVGWATNQCKRGSTFMVCVDSGKAVTAALTLSMYVYNATAGLWAKYPDQDITTATIDATQRCQAFDGKWLVVTGDRVAAIPTAGTVDAGNVTILWACN